MSEFRVDRPGRYSTRNGEAVLVRADAGGTDTHPWKGPRYFYGNNGRIYQGIDVPRPHDLIAYLGQLEEEEEKRETLCWNCSKPYPMYDPWCPFCRATNANVDQKAARAEATAKTQPEGIITRLERELAEALAEVSKLKLEIAALEKSRNHCEFCDREIAKPRVSIPLTTPQLDRYTTPMLGTQR